MPGPDEPGAPRWTITRLARRFRLARSTLLYYDRLGLLRPTGRTRAGYRVYDAAAEQRLAQICAYRDAGVPLREIRRLLDARTERAAVLLARLRGLDAEIARCREQQRVIVKLLEQRDVLARTRTLDKERWVAILGAAGLDDDAMWRWHASFERDAPDAHQDFLEALGLDAAEIARIRASSSERGQP